MEQYQPAATPHPPAQRPGAAGRPSDEVFQGSAGGGGGAGKSSGGIGIALGCIGCGVLAVIGLVAALGGFFYLGSEVLAEAVGEDLRDHPVVLEHIGQIEAIDTEMLKSIATEGDLFVYRVKGSKGSGLLRVESVSHDDGSEEVVSGTLQVDGGSEIDLFPDG